MALQAWMGPWDLGPWRSQDPVHTRPTPPPHSWGMSPSPAGAGQGKGLCSCPPGPKLDPTCHCSEALTSFHPYWLPGLSQICIRCHLVRSPGLGPVACGARISPGSMDWKAPEGGWLLNRATALGRELRDCGELRVLPLGLHPGNSYF